MKKYEDFKLIKKADIEFFSGLEGEISFAPFSGVKRLPLEISRFGITNPDKNYRIKRNPSPCFIIEYILSGEGFLEINGDKHKLEQNDAYIIHPGDICEYYSSSKNPYRKYWINFRSSIFFDFIKSYDVMDRVIHGVDLKDSFEELFNLEKISNKNDDLCLPVSKVIYDIIFKIAMHQKEKSEMLDRGLAANVKDYLEHSLNTDISMDTLEEAFYHSKSHITKEFKKAYNTTPYAYLMDLRMEFAKNLLKTTDKTIKEIAEYLCFSSEYHFSNFFKEKENISPRNYKKSLILQTNINNNID